MLARLKGLIPKRSAPSPAPPPQDDTPPFALRVSENGEELFARPFPAGDFVIGASPAADIVIPELVADEAVSLHLEQSRLGAGLVRITALDEGITARGRALDVGEVAVFPNGRASFSIDSFLFDVSHQARPALAAPGAAPFLVGAGVLLAVAAIWVSYRGGTPEPAPVPATIIPEDNFSAPPATPQQRLAAAEADLRARLIAANLAPPLNIRRERSTLIVSGVVTADERSRTAETIASFRQRLAVPVEMDLTSDPNPVGFIVAVALKPEAYVLGRDGRRYTLRQTLPDGGVIEAIDSTSVLIDRDGLKERVTYAK